MTPQTTSVPAPFALADPADEALFFQQDKMHFPDPLAPMELAMIESAIGRGFTHGARAYDAPIARVEVRAVNGYEYQSFVPMTGTPEEMAAQGALAEAAVRGAIGRLDELWSEQILPEVRAHLGFWDAFDLAGATRAAFAAHVAETWERLARVWELHFEIVLPAYLAVSEFDELYRGLFPAAGPLDSYRLVEGLPNMTVEVGQALWRLSRVALASRDVRDVLTSRPAAEVPAALYASAAGRAFLADLEAYVDEYGRRADKWTILAPSWTEDPTPVIERLQDFIRRPESDAPAVTTQSAAVARERAIAEARDGLRDYPAQIAGQFEGMLAAAQAGLVISEDHNFWIDNMSIHHLRAVLLEAGRRLVADGAIVASDDVFMLTPDELQFALESRRREPAPDRRRAARGDRAPAHAHAAAGPRRDPDRAAAGRPVHALCHEVQRRPRGPGERARGARLGRLLGHRPRHRARHLLDLRGRPPAARRHPRRRDDGPAVDAAVRDGRRRRHRHRRRPEPLRRRRPRVRHPRRRRHRHGHDRHRRRHDDRGRRRCGHRPHRLALARRSSPRWR